LESHFLKKIAPIYGANIFLKVTFQNSASRGGNIFWKVTVMGLKNSTSIGESNFHIFKRLSW
jgi:hypothetical protein